MQNITIKVGDVVRDSPFGGGERTVRITRVYADVKNGRPGYDGAIVGIEDGDVWGYTDQIICLV
jgi:hypothetical protein